MSVIKPALFIDVLLNYVLRAGVAMCGVCENNVIHQ